MTAGGPTDEISVSQPSALGKARRKTIANQSGRPYTDIDVIPY